MTRESLKGLSELAAASASQSSFTAGVGSGPQADVIQEPRAQDGVIGTAAAALVERLKGVEAYLHDKSPGDTVDDLTTLIRRYPIPALFIGVGLGYALGRSRQRSRS